MKDDLGPEFMISNSTVYDLEEMWMDAKMPAVCPRAARNENTTQTSEIVDGPMDLNSEFKNQKPGPKSKIINHK